MLHCHLFFAPIFLGFLLQSEWAEQSEQLGLKLKSGVEKTGMMWEDSDNILAGRLPFWDRAMSLLILI